MKPRFAWSLPMVEVSALGAIRRWSGLEALEASSLVWLRAARLDDQQWDSLRRLPGTDRYTVRDDGQLIPADALVPRGRLPDGPWQPLERWLEVELSPADEPVARSVSLPTTTLQLVRSVIEREPTWLQTSLAAWTAYVVVAPQVRLARWTFVADDRGRVIIRGAPLPPLPGTRYVEQDGIAVPLGFTWSPRLPTDVLRESFALADRDSILCTAEGTHEKIAAEDWVQATRSAARQTIASLTPDS